MIIFLLFLASLEFVQAAVLSRRDTNIASNGRDDTYAKSLGQLNSVTTINSGITHWLSGGGSHNIFGNLRNSGNLIISQTDYLKKFSLALGQVCDFSGSDAANGNLINYESGFISLNDYGSLTGPTYNWQLSSLENRGGIQFCGRGDTGGSTYNLFCSKDCYNYGVIDYEQYNNNHGGLFFWRNKVLSTSATSANVYNNGALRLVNVVFHSVQNILGNGCIIVGSNAVLYLEDGSGLYQNPSKGPVYPQQTIYFSDSNTGTLHMDMQVYKVNSNFGPQIFNFGAGRAIEFTEIIRPFAGFSYTNGILTVNFLLGNKVNLKIGLGYDSSQFYVATNPQKYNLIGYNAIFYGGKAPSQTVPGTCRVSMGFCANPTETASVKASTTSTTTTSNAVTSSVKSTTAAVTTTTTNVSTKSSGSSTTSTTIPSTVSSSSSTTTRSTSLVVTFPNTVTTVSSNSNQVTASATTTFSNIDSIPVASKQSTTSAIGTTTKAFSTSSASSSPSVQTSSSSTAVNTSPSSSSSVVSSTSQNWSIPSLSVSITTSSTSSAISGTSVDGKSSTPSTSSTTSNWSIPSISVSSSTFSASLISTIPNWSIPTISVTATASSIFTTNTDDLKTSTSSNWSIPSISVAIPTSSDSLSTSTGSSSSTAITTLASTTCGVAGYDKQSPLANKGDSSGQYSNVETCKRFCGVATGTSFAVGADTCLCYNAPVAENLNVNPSSSYKFYDASCYSEISSSTTSEESNSLIGTFTSSVSIPTTSSVTLVSTSTSEVISLSTESILPSSTDSYTTSTTFTISSTTSISTTETSSTTSSASAAFTLTCGLPGYDRQNPRSDRNDFSGQYSTLATCKAYCGTSANSSFAVSPGTGACLCYSAPLAENFNPVASSQYFFYDAACSDVSSDSVISSGSSPSTTNSVTMMS